MENLDTEFPPKKGSYLYIINTFIRISYVGWLTLFVMILASVNILERVASTVLH